MNEPAQTPAAPPPKPEAATIVAIWGESGMGKTHFACTIGDPPAKPGDFDFGPTCLLTCDKGQEVVAPLIRAGRVHPVAFKGIDDLRRRLTALDLGMRGKPGGLTTADGRPFGSVVIDAWSTLMRNEGLLQGMENEGARERALKLIGPFEAAFGAVRMLGEAGMPIVTVTHARDRASPSTRGAKTREGGETQVPTPDIFPSMMTGWMGFHDHVWLIEKHPGCGPDGKRLRQGAYLRPRILLHTQPVGGPKDGYYVKHCKTRGIAFADWIGEEFWWDTSWQKPQSLSRILGGARKVNARVAALIAEGCSEAEAYERAAKGVTAPKPDAIAPAA